jgi:DNA modification methylase
MLYNTNCFNIFKKLKDKSVDLVVTDIPYGEVNRTSNDLRKLDKGAADVVTFDLDAFVTECVRVCKGSIYIFCGIGQVSTIRAKLVQLKLSTRLCIWEKTNPSPMNGDKLWLSGIECCVYGKFPKATFNQHCKNSVFRFPCGRNKIHPTQKPLPLISYLIESSSNEGDTVFDPCMGSGTTGEACLKLNRKFIGCELNTTYYLAAKERIENALL